MFDVTVKYRIVSSSNGKLRKQKFLIQRKFLFWWVTIEKEENCIKESLNFSSFEEAKNYMVEKYFSETGEVFQPSENEFHYTKCDDWDEFDYMYF